MPVRVEIEGRGEVAEFPDGTPDDVIEQTVRREFFGPQGSAVTRFGKKFIQAVNPIPAVKAVLTQPGQLVRNLVDTRGQFRAAGEAFARAIPGGNVEPSVMDPRSRLDHAIEGAYRGVAAIPVLGPIADALTQDLSSSVRSGDLAGAAGTLTGVVAGPKIIAKAAAPVKSLAPLLRGSAEKGYAKIFSKNADAAVVERVVPELIDRKLKLKDPANLATQADAELAKLPKGTKVPPDFSAPGVKPLNREAGLWSDTKNLAEGAPASQTISQVAAEGFAQAAERALLSFIEPHAGMSLATLKLGQTVKNIMQTPQWRTASAIKKAQLAEALQAGKLDHAAAIIGEIQRGGALVGNAQEQALQGMMRR